MNAVPRFPSWAHDAGKRRTHRECAKALVMKVTRHELTLDQEIASYDWMDERFPELGWADVARDARRRLEARHAQGALL